MPILNNDDILVSGSYEGLIVNPLTAETRGAEFFNEDTVVIPSGRCVCQGAADTGLILPVDANSVPRGIAMLPVGIEKRDGYSLDAVGDFGWPVDWPMPMFVRGDILVYYDEAVTPADNVFMIHTAYTGAKVGQFRTDANTDKAIQIVHARPLESGGPGLVKTFFDFNLPNA
ncbi:MAG: hypothetical protein AAGF24_02205 [Cyanobacteria bacterium P01_H01_bin.121]